MPKCLGSEMSVKHDSCLLQFLSSQESGNDNKILWWFCDFCSKICLMLTKKSLCVVMTKNTTW